MLNSQHFNVGRTLKNPVLILASVLVLVVLASWNVVRDGHAVLLGYPWYSNPAFVNPAESRYVLNGYSQTYPVQTASTPSLMYIPYAGDYANSIAGSASLASNGLQYPLQGPAASALRYSPNAEPFAGPSIYPERLRMEEGFRQPLVNYFPSSFSMSRLHSLQLTFYHANDAELRS